MIEENYYLSCHSFKTFMSVNGFNNAKYHKKSR
jgi:hypothetical protein